LLYVLCLKTTAFPSVIGHLALQTGHLRHGEVPLQGRAQIRIDVIDGGGMLTIHNVVGFGDNLLTWPKPTPGLPFSPVAWWDW
jgi:hypothetical protein